MLFRSPMRPSEATGCVRAWLEQPNVRVLPFENGHVESVLALLEELGAAGNLVTDAQIAAAAIEHGAVVHTTDSDFVRFDRLRWLNPLTGAGSRNRRR